MLWQDLLVESAKQQAKGNLPEAIMLLNKLLLENPDCVPAWNNRASMLCQLGHPFDGVVNYDRAIALDPEAFETYNNRGAAFMDLELFDRALKDLFTAIFKGGRIPQVYNNRGSCYMRQGRWEDALKEFETATAIDDNYVDGHIGHSMCLLKLGRYKEGWKEYEWRWKSTQMVPRGFPYPEWKGEPAGSDGDVLLLYAEQGMGDAIQFMRYVELVKEKFWHGQVHLEVRPPLARIARTMKHADAVIPFGEEPGAEISYCAPLMSLPRILWSETQDIPAKCPYIYADKYRAWVFKEQLKQMPPGLLIGVCWAGMNREDNALASSVDKRRSLTLDTFAPAAKTPNLAWISLQMGPPAEQVKTPPSGMRIGDFTRDFYDFYDTAAMIENLDLVITVDTSVAHLAGALGKPVWMLSRFDGCWRWLLDSEKTPWYPTMRIFTQKKPYDWAEVMQRVDVELKKFEIERREAAAA